METRGERRYIMFFDKIFNFFFGDEIRFNYKSNHYGVIKKKKHKRFTSVFMSTSSTNEGKDNIEMEANADPNNPKKSYFMKRVRTYDKSTYGPRQKNMRLTPEDKKKSDQIYEQYLKNKSDRESGKKNNKK